MNRTQGKVAVLAVLVIAVSLRLGSLFWSPLPYNPDGIFYASWARQALELGHVQLDGFATDSLGFTTLLATVARVTGHPPLYIAQVVSALVGGSTVLFAVAFARRLSPSSWSPGRRRIAGVVAGLVLAVDGLYLYRSMATDETTAGLVLVPLLALAVGRSVASGTRRWGLVALVVVLTLPPLHNHDGILGALVVTMVVSYWLASSPSVRSAGVALGSLGAIWAWVIGYHPVMAALTSARVIQTGRLHAAPGLFLAWIAVVSIAVAWFVTTSRRLQRGTVTAVVGSWFVALGLNAVVLVFPGTMPTSTTLLVLLVPLAVPALLGTLGVDRLVRGSLDGHTTAVLALIAAPASLIGFAFTAGLTPVNLATAFRTHLYVHLPIFTLAGVVLVGGLWRIRLTRSIPAKTVAVAVVVLCAAVSIPIAFSGLEHRPYKTITTPAEFQGTGFAVAHVQGPLATDDHLARVAGYHDPGRSISGRAGWLRPGNVTDTGPVYEWLRDGGRPPGCTVLAQRSWTTTGAQFYPQSPVRIAESSFQTWLATNDVVYATGTDDPLVVVRPRSGRTAGC